MSEQSIKGMLGRFNKIIVEKIREREISWIDKMVIDIPVGFWKGVQIKYDRYDRIEIRMKSIGSVFNSVWNNSYIICKYGDKILDNIDEALDSWVENKKQEEKKKEERKNKCESKLKKILEGY